MTEIPVSLVREIDSLLGIRGKPHLVQVGNSLVDSGCIDWPLPLNSEGYWAYQDKRNETFTQIVELYQAGNEQAARDLSGTADEKTASYKPQTSQDDVNSLLYQARNMAESAGVIIYRSRLTWFSVRAARAELLVVAPITDQFDILRIEHTFSSNQSMDTEMIIHRLSLLISQFGIDIVGADDVNIEFLLNRVPMPKTSEFRNLKRRLGRLCMEVKYDDLDLSMRRVALWWD